MFKPNHLGVEVFNQQEQKRLLNVWKKGDALYAAINSYRSLKVGPPDYFDANPSDWWNPRFLFLHNLGTNYLPGLPESDYVIDTPTLYLWGERDEFLIKESLDHIGGWVLDVEVKLFDTDHFLPDEDPTAVSNAIKVFGNE